MAEPESRADRMPMVAAATDSPSTINVNSP